MLILACGLLSAAFEGLFLWAVCLAGLFSSMSLGSPLSLYALAPEGPAVPMTAAFVTSHGKADPKTAHLKPIVLEESGLDLSRSVSISTRFTVKVGASFIRTFHTGNLFAEDHNAFKIIVSNTNGAKYKYVIVKRPWLKLRISRIHRWQFCYHHQCFNVYIVDTGTRELTGHVKISSFYNN